ncbi:MAG: hypothetical protein RMN51_09885 [Verrucomicrobiota bacterium]|nr:hypothetical protein [Limisphaera sp.]MDW8382399.1 hypothetical protein [Verrucomicrobiota bacterium]
MFRRCITASLAIVAASAVQATVYTFVPNDGSGDPDDIWDLDHSNWYTWGIKNFSIPANEVITEAVLTIYNINNWTAAENGRNWLRLYLLDTAENPSNGRVDEANPPTGRLRRYSDTDNGIDNIAGLSWTAKRHIATYTDNDGGPRGDVVTLVYSFSTLGLLGDLTSYIANGNNFGLGFDPDCHFWNTGVKFTITTGTRRLPEGGVTLLLLAFGVGATAWMGRGRSA